VKSFLSSPAFFLAPMAELSHRALRELIEELCAVPRFCPRPFPVYVTEMTSAAALLSGGPFEQWYLDGGPCPERLIYQLAGADTRKLAAAAALLDRRECLGIDLNMGCAAPAITKTGAGVRWMEDIDKAGRLAAAIRRKTTKLLSVKLRLGPKTAAARTQESYGEQLPGFEYLLGFCRRLEAEGVDFITLHPRTAAEKFKRRARWEYIRALRNELTISVVGNGDLDSPEELASGAREGPVMAGRLLVREPWAFALAARRCRNLSPRKERHDAVTAAVSALSGSTVSGLMKENEAGETEELDLEVIGLRYLKLLTRHQPPEFHLSRARRFFAYFCDNLVWGNYLKTLLNRENELSGIERTWRGYFVEHGEERRACFHRRINVY
jgi:tRNA-dihydrouridine synthase